MQILYRKRIYPELYIVCGFRWNERYKQDLFTSRIDTTKTLAQAIAASPTPPRSWVLVSGVGESWRSDTKNNHGVHSRLLLGASQTAWIQIINERRRIFSSLHSTDSLLQAQSDSSVHRRQWMDPVRSALQTCERVGGLCTSSWECGKNHQTSHCQAWYCMLKLLHTPCCA